MCSDEEASVKHQHTNESATYTNRSRRILRRSIHLAFQDSIHLLAHTLEVSPSGLTLMSPLQIAKGKICNIAFDIPMDGEVHKVSAISKTHDCVCIGTAGFRTRLKFVHIDNSSQQAITDLMHYGY